MKLGTIFTLVLSVSAASLQLWSGGNNEKCLSDADAQYFVNGTIVFLQHKDASLANKTAQQIYSPGFVEFSDSINALFEDPLGTQVESSRTGYIAEALKTPSVPTINTLDIIHSCHQISWHWEFIGIGPQRIRGFHMMRIDSQFQIYRQEIELNSLSWAKDIGFTVTPPSPGSSAAGDVGP